MRVHVLRGGSTLVVSCPRSVQKHEEIVEEIVASWVVKTKRKGERRGARNPVEVLPCTQTRMKGGYTRVVRENHGGWSVVVRGFREQREEG